MKRFEDYNEMVMQKACGNGAVDSYAVNTVLLMLKDKGIIIEQKDAYGFLNVIQQGYCTTESLKAILAFSFSL